MALEIVLIVAIGLAAFFAVRYIVVQHRRHGCVGCSMAKQCGHDWKNCVRGKTEK